MAAINVNLSCDLQKPIKVQYLDGILFSQDNQANIINVEVLNGEEPATISGDVTANVIRSDGGTVAVTGGSISDNVCSIALPSAAYYFPGVVSIVVKLTTSGVITTIAAVVANVYQSSTDTIVDPGTIIPSIQTLISSIETAVASIPADYSSLWTSLAPAFSSSSSYVAGQYVTYNGGLYRFTTAHSGSWSSSDVVATNLGGDVSDLKSAIVNGLKDNLLKYAFPKTPQSNNGISLYFNADYSITINGTATANAWKQFMSSEDNVILPPGKYVLSGCTTGSASTYEIFFGGKPIGGGSDIFAVRVRTEPIEITLAQSAVVRAGINVISGMTVNNVTLYPAIHAGVKRNYSPWYMNNEELYKSTEVVNRKPILCVSTYRSDFKSGSDDYYYAISYDGKSFFEIKGSKGFAGSGLVSSDIQPFEWNNGLLMLCTDYHLNGGSGDSIPTFDFRASYTNDFVHYYSAMVNLGFIEASYQQEPYVWAPQIRYIDGHYYITASISTDKTTRGDKYTDSSVTTRNLRPYYIEVDLSFDGNSLQITPATGATLKPLKIKINDETASVMDVSLFYSNAESAVYAVYKDRIYNIVNLAKSTTGIDGSFTDEDLYLGNMAYIEAGFFSNISNQLYVYICGYGYATYTLRKPIIYGKYSTQGWEEVGCVNPAHTYADTTPAGMRNPNPIEISNELAKKFNRVYSLPASIDSFEQPKRALIRKRGISSKISDVIYHTFGRYTKYPSKWYIPSSETKEVDEETVNCDMCFMNDPAIVEITNAGATNIKTPQGDATVTKETDGAEMFMFTHGNGIKLSDSLT